jgi:uncharacterized paraquat-inducible protein A
MAPDYGASYNIRVIIFISSILFCLAAVGALAYLMFDRR